MKKILLYLSYIAIPALAQTPPVQWEKSVNGQLSGYDNTYGSWKDPNNNFLLTGSTESNAFLLKLDNNGNQLLKLVYDGPQHNYDIGYAVRSDAAGNVYVGGTTVFNTRTVPFMVKYNATGTKLWEYVQGAVTTDGAFTAMALDNYTNPSFVYFTGSKNDSSAITKLNVNTGVSLWEKTLWPHGKMNDIDMDNNGHPLVCGYQAFSGLNADFYAAVLDINTGYPLRGCWKDGLATDSVNDPMGHFDQAAKIKAGPAGTFVVFGTLYNSPTAATMYMVKFGSTGNVPVWQYSYDSPNHSEGKGIQLLTDVSFSNFYYLAKAMSTTGSYYNYAIAGRVNNTGVAIWEKEFNKPAINLDAHDMALDANGNAHVLTEMSNPQDLYYLKLAAATGNATSTLQYDNQRNGGNAYDYATNIFTDNTGHPYMIGSSNANTYTNQDVLMCRLNTNATLDWDITYDFFVTSQNHVFNIQTIPGSSGGDQIITCGEVINNITSLDASITSYNETGGINWQQTFDDANGGDHVVGFEKSYSNNLFLCTFSYSNNTTSLTEFYSDGTTNFTFKPGWVPQPTCFKLDSAENAFVGATLFNYNDFYVGIYLRNSGSAIINVPASSTSIQTSANDIASDNSNIYIAGYRADFTGSGIQHMYIQKYNLAANRQWSAKITGFDSTANPRLQKIVYDRTSGSVYVMGTATSVGSAVTKMVLARLDVNGNIIWVKSENAVNTRNQSMTNLVVSNGYLYVSGTANNITGNDNYILVEKWNVNGTKQWEYIFNKPAIDDQGSGLVVDNAGNIFAGGKTNGSVTNPSMYDMILLKITAAGNLVWKREYNGPGNADDEGTGLALSLNHSSNPRIYQCGNTQNQGFYFDIGTLKYCDLPTATISYSGSTNICQNSSITLASTGTGSGNTLWSPGGQSGGAVIANTSGAYYFTYTESDGCATISDTVTIHIKSAPAPVQICMVTVDDSSKHNLILWNKTSASPDVIGFNVYREDLTNIYHQIGSVPYSSLSEYVDKDANANPNTTTKRYKLTTVDSCGNESAMSNYHNTIYIVSNGGGQFSWNQLYTIENSANPVAQYILLRDDYNTNAWHAIDSTAGTQFNINDINFATFQPTANWRVVTQWNISCTPTARMANGNTIQAAIVKSKSNITNNRMVSVGTLNEKNVAVYPNPSANSLTVNVPYSAKTIVKITSLLGEEVYSATITNSDVQQIDISKFASGTYLLQVSSESGKFIKRIVKE
ncbi:MAG TPA: T9SS type A sorting domain-containing protein [Bacteroidia bacterium]|nr:T9SS type A sorting domain-containing protein [Bacteroidia bacterium]